MIISISKKRHRLLSLICLLLLPSSIYLLLYGTRLKDHLVGTLGGALGLIFLVNLYPFRQQIGFEDDYTVFLTQGNRTRHFTVSQIQSFRRNLLMGYTLKVSHEGTFHLSPCLGRMDGFLERLLRLRPELGLDAKLVNEVRLQKEEARGYVPFKLTRKELARGTLSISFEMAAFYVLILFQPMGLKTPKDFLLVGGLFYFFLALTALVTLLGFQEGVIAVDRVIRHRPELAKWRRRENYRRLLFWSVRIGLIVTGIAIRLKLGRT